MLLPTPNSLLLFTATFLATGYAGPVTSPAMKSSVLTPRTNDCGDSTFVDETSGGSPTIADCQQLASNIVNGGSWYFSTGAFVTIATYGTCAFGANFDIPAQYIGNEDIIDLINSSVDMFSWNNLVGSKGVMKCGLGTANWGLFHT